MRHLSAKKRSAREKAIDAAVRGVRRPYPFPRFCLQSCVLLERILETTLPPPRFSLRLGALHVHTDHAIGPMIFDPRGPEGIDAGFHAWLEDTAGQLLDPSVLVTLAAEGYDVEADTYPIGDGRTLSIGSLTLCYEPLPELELLGLAESEHHLAAAMALALERRGHPFRLGPCFLDVGFRASGLR